MEYKISIIVPVYRVEAYVERCVRSLFEQTMSNSYIWSYPSLPLHLRIVGGCTAIRLWPVIDLWVWTKKWLGRK